MSKHRPPTLEPRTGPPGTVVVALGSRAWISLGILAALGATILGLAAVGAASLGHPAFRALGFSLLGAGGATAALFRWKLWARERHDLDLGAVADLETARERLAQGDAAAASVAASRSATCARTPYTRNDALRTVAWAALEQGYPERAKAALDQTEPPYAVDLYCFAAVESARGALESAIAALEVARSAGSLTCEEQSSWSTATSVVAASTAPSWPQFRTGWSSAPGTATPSWPLHPAPAPIRPRPRSRRRFRAICYRLLEPSVARTPAETGRRFWLFNQPNGSTACP